jgi:hypothetical protein
MVDRRPGGHELAADVQPAQRDRPRLYYSPQEMAYRERQRALRVSGRPQDSRPSSLVRIVGYAE